MRKVKFLKNQRDKMKKILNKINGLRKRIIDQT